MRLPIISDLKDAITEFNQTTSDFRKFVNTDFTEFVRESTTLVKEMQGAVKKLIVLVEETEEPIMNILKSPQKLLPRTIAAGVMDAFGRFIGMK